MPSGLVFDKKLPYGARRRSRSIFGAGLISASILGAGFLAAPAAIAPAFAQDARTLPSFADLADKVRPAVVSVNVKSNGAVGDVASRDMPGMPDLPNDHPLREFFDQFKRGQPAERRPSRAQGSGFLISADGYVVTNHHVADKADEIEVTFDNEEKYKATIIGSDARTDVALLKIDSKKTFPTYLTFAQKAPRVGDWVLAVGNPFGLGGTVTAGIVSASGRDIGSGPYDFLQIDAAVNKGNSGGPSVNLSGEVVGVNTAIYSPSGGSVGIAFAVPALTAQDVVEKLKKDGRVSSGWLGVQIQAVDENLAEGLSLKSTKGALIAKILPDGPASKSELKAQDVILKVNETPINSQRELARVVASLSPNSDARLHIVRSGNEMDLIVKLGEYPSGDKLASLGGPGESGAGKELEDLGLTLVPSSEFPGAKTKDGVAVSSVEPGSKAADQQIRRGDIITEVGGKAVTSVDDVSDGIRDAREKGKKNVLLQLRSRDQQRYLTLPVEPKADKDANKDQNKDKDSGKRNRR